MPLHTGFTPLANKAPRRWLKKLRLRLLGLGLLLVAGCATPDLRPFAEATDSVASGIRQGGDRIVADLAREPSLSGTTPDALQAEWGVRKQAADALVAYSGSLAAIAEASAHRKAHAAALHESLQTLAGSIPGVNLAAGAGGEAFRSVISAIIEVKAARDLAAAVRAADPAIQTLAAALKADFASISTIHLSHFRTAQMIASGSDIRDLRRLHEKLLAEQQNLRVAAARDLASPSALELARIDALLAPVRHDLQAHDALIARQQARIDEILLFHRHLAAAIDAWAAGHADLAAALAQNRRPDLVLLVARARELQEAVASLKTAP